jgi:hypothetical protein
VEGGIRSHWQQRGVTLVRCGRSVHSLSEFRNFCSSVKPSAMTDAVCSLVVKITVQRPGFVTDVSLTPADANDGRSYYNCMAHAHVPVVLPRILRTQWWSRAMLPNPDKKGKWWMGQAPWW